VRQSAPMQDVDVCFAGAFEQARLIRDGELSVVELVSATLGQIERSDSDVNAFRVVFDEGALAVARKLDAAPSGDPARLRGVPVAVKDDCDVTGEVTAWGTDAYGHAAVRDAEVIRRLRAAGAVIIGKTHVPEMTAWPWTSSTTWGTTRNPWDLARTPGGSSGGSAVAAAMGMCGVALGSDGGGSVRYPAGLCGVFGLKPQRDRIPLDPHVGAWNGLLAIGSLSRTVRDAALFLDATAGTATASTLSTPLRGLRIAVSFDPPRGSFARLHTDARRAVEATAELLSTLGHRVFEGPVDYGNTMWQSTLRYLDGVARDVDTLAHPQRLDPATRRLARLGSVLPKRAVAHAVAAQRTIAACINRAFESADLLLTPMAGQPAPEADTTQNRGVMWSLLHSNVAAWAVPWNVVGQPAASIPAGFDTDGRPLSVQLCGPPNSEGTVLNLATQIEAARPWAHHRPPGRTTPSRER
jgi:amidase